ncbi:MAG: flap endonuclease-1 [Candidatus Nanoarchaeia archaeon]
MGVDLRPILLRHEITLENLSGKVLAIDAFNQLYMYLAVIRQSDGAPLTDSKGNITSHLSGLFYRTLNLLEVNIKPVFVFDGKAPEEKFAIQKERAELREKAQKKYEEALAEEKLEEARKYAQQAVFLNKDVIVECKELLSAMGLPWVQAPAEGEAQAAAMALKGDVWGVVSQDYDSLLFGTPRLIRNLTISGKRRFNSKIIEIKPELIDLAECLNYLGIDIEKLIEIGLLIGTDYNAGILGIGPKTALKIVRENKFNEYLPNAERLKNLFLKPLVSLDYSLDWKKPNKEKIKEILVDTHDFSLERVEAAIKRLNELEKPKQTGLDAFV